MDYLKAGITEFREETVDVYGTPDYVADQGTCVRTYGQPSVSERGNYRNAGKQVDGRWRLQANIWNTNAATAAQAK